MKQRRIDIPLEKIEAFCHKWKIQEFALFGSVLREDFRPDSDVDILVTFEPDGGFTFDNRVEMLDEIEKIFGRKVDLIDRKVVERTENYLRRRHILQSSRSMWRDDAYLLDMLLAARRIKWSLWCRRKTVNA